MSNLKFAVFPRIEDLPDNIPAEKLGLTHSNCTNCKEPIYLLTKEIDKDAKVICTHCMDYERLECHKNMLNDIKIKVRHITNEINNKINIPKFIFAQIEEQIQTLELGIKLGLLAAFTDDHDKLIDALDIINMNNASVLNLIREFRSATKVTIKETDNDINKLLNDIKMH